MSLTLSRRATRVLMAAASFVLVTACPEPPPADTTPPASPALSVGTITESSIQLSWTAVGDDGSTGTAAGYELRYLSAALCPITQANFDSATPASGLGAPQPVGTAESFTVTGLPADAAVCLMLKVTDDAGNASFSGAAVASTLDLVAPERAALTAGSVTGSSVVLSWTAVGDNGSTGTATGYDLRQASGAGCPITAANFGSAAAVSGVPAPAAPGTSQSVTATGLAGAIDYCFALRVTDEVGNSSLSASLPVTTSDTVAPAAASLQVGAITGTSVALSWTAVGDDGNTGTATSYELRYASGGGCPLTSATFPLGTAATGLPTPGSAGAAESFTVTGLSSDTAYCFMLRVADDAGNSSLSGSAAGSTRDVTAPAAAAISVTNVTGTNVRIGWLAVGDDGSTGTATSYELRHATGAACPLVPATFDSGTAVPGLPSPAAAGSSESFTVTALASDTPYCFMLKVTDDGGNASFSNSLPQRTPDVISPAAAALTAGVVGATTIQVVWTAVGDDGNTGTATSHDLRYRSGASCPISAANFATSTQVTGLAAPRAPGQPEAFIVQGLASDTSYCFMLQVVDDAGNTSLSNALDQATPDVTAPGAITLTAAVLDTEFRFNWTAVGDDGNTGTATSQELRYLSGAACPIDSGNFATGTQVAGLGAPAAPGTPESFNVTGLQRQTTYCFALRVQDEVGNASISNTFTGTTPDTAGPDTAVLATGAFTKTSMHVTWTAVGDDGATGTASSYVLRYLSGAACPIDGGNFGSGTVVATGTPQPAGAPEDVLVTGLTPGTTYCFALQVSDDASNTSLSGSASGTTLPDTAAPGPVSDLAIGTTTASSLQLTWTAVADDGTDPASGPVSSHELRSLSGAACPINAGNFATGAAVPLGAPGAPGVAESATASGLAPGVSYCFMVRVTDGVGSATFSNAATGATVDNRPPAPVTNLVALGPDAMGTVGLSWTATGAHAGTGTATAYDLRYEVGGDCATFDFATAIPVGGLSPPQPVGTPETFTLNGLNIFEQYCFGLQVTNETPNSSLSNIALAWAGASAQIAQIRSIMHGATSSPVALDAAVQGAIVTYLKATVNGRPPGIPDGPGFFIQGSGTGPALFFAMDPQVTLPGMAVSDVVDLHVTQGAWTTCPAPPCTADNGTYTITQATATPRSTGITLPASQDLTNVTLTLPITAGPWEYEHERVSATGTIGTIFTAGAGFSRANFTTPGTASPHQEFRFTDAVMVSKGLIDGCTVTVNGTPMWRFGGFAQFSAWAPGDVTPSGCPPISITTTIPLDLEAGVSPTTPIVAAFNQPMAPASMTGQTTPGLCSGTFQVSGDEFATCVPFTSATGNMGLNNMSADFTLAQTLKGIGAYKLRITTGAASGNGNTLSPAYTQPAGFTVTGGTCVSVAPVVISQVYPAGGNSGAIWDHDYVELHNRGTAPVSLAGWSIQYASAIGTAGWLVSPLPATASIAPGGFFLVQMAGGTNGAPLPAPDVINTGGAALAMGANAGKVALVTGTAPMNGQCPTPGRVVDFVGYGTANCSEGGAPAPATSSILGVFRGDAVSPACVDTNANATDFAATTPAPRNSAATPNTCACP